MSEEEPPDVFPDSDGFNSLEVSFSEDRTNVVTRAITFLRGHDTDGVIVILTLVLMGWIPYVVDDVKATVGLCISTLLFSTFALVFRRNP